MKKKLFSAVLASVPLLSCGAIALAQDYQENDFAMTGVDGLGQFIAAFTGIIVAFAFFSFIIGIGIYIYVALAYMRIAQKLNVKNPWLVWIPIANMYIMAEMAQMPTWPVFLAIGLIIPFVNFFAAVALSIFSIVWNWKIFERMGRPGWWILLSFIPAIGPILIMVFLGMMAWGKDKNSPVTPATPPANV